MSLDIPKCQENLCLGKNHQHEGTMKRSFLECCFSHPCVRGWTLEELNYDSRRTEGVGVCTHVHTGAG